MTFTALNMENKECIEDEFHEEETLTFAAAPLYGMELSTLGGRARFSFMGLFAAAVQRRQ
jgi:hypothetical protein